MNKKYIAIGMMAMLTLTGCQDEFSNTALNREGGITATIATEDGAATRAVMIDAPTQAMNLRWTEGDAIGVFDAENNNTRFAAAAADISKDSTQAVFRSGGAVPKAAFLAYFPHQAGATGNASEVHLTMPVKQQYIERDLKSEPDPAASIMVGSGYSNAVSFRNVHAILKVNYVPRDSDVVTGIVFRDLSGQPVSGAFSVTLDAEGTPTATFPTTGEGETIMLDCGAGVEVAPTSISTFFMVVPAREYAKGFQLDFLLQNSETDIRTIGRRAGKTLLRSMVYNVGDVSVISDKDYTVVFNEDGGVIFDDDLMAMVYSVKSLGTITGEEGYGDYYELMVKPSMGLKEGMTVIINQQSEALPRGLIGKVACIKDLSSTTQQVRVMKYRHGEEAFKKLQIGPADALNDDGTPNEDKMVGIDLTRNFSRFVPAEGMDGVSVKVTPEGLVLTDEGWVPNTVVTRGVVKGDLQFPRFAINLKNTDTDRISVGAAPGIQAGIGASIIDGKVEYIAFSLTPSLKLDVGIEKTFELANFVDEEKAIGTLYFTPITVGPVVLVPLFRLSGFVSVKGELKISATWSYTIAFNVGATYQNAYNSEGWLFRCSNKGDGLPTPSLLIPDMTASANISAKLGMILDVGLSFYGIIDFTLFAKAGMEFKAGFTYYVNSGRLNGGLSMTPICETGAAVGILGLVPARSTMAQIDADPWWYRSIYPHARVYIERDDLSWNDPDKPSQTLYARLVNETFSIPLRAWVAGPLLEDVEMTWRVMRRPKGASSLFANEELVGDYSKTTYPKCGFWSNEGYVQEMDIKYSLPKHVVDSEDYIYSIYLYCKPVGAVQGAYAPIEQSATITPLGRIEVERVNDSYIFFKDERHDYFIMRDDYGGASVDEDGNINPNER